MQKWQSKVPEQYKESVEASLRAVVALAKSKLDSGKKVTFAEMTRELEKFLIPMTHAKSPAAARREAGKAMEAKKNQATAALQGAARSGSRPAPAPQTVKVNSAADVFDRFRDMIGSGHKKLKN
jgi:hypothetical protein